MAKVTIAGRAYEIAPYKMAAMLQAAPLIDRINASSGALTTLEGTIAAATDLLGVLAIGIQRFDPAMTLDALQDLVGIDDVESLRDSFMEVLAEAGLITAEPA